MGVSADHGERTRAGLRRAVRDRKSLGGLRPATEQRNRQTHVKALQMALAYRHVLEAGRDKSLAALSRDLAAAGCLTGSGAPLTRSMVRLLRFRLDAALLALADGTLPYESGSWNPREVCLEAVRERNEIALRWSLRMASKECGPLFADRLRQVLLASKDADWVRDALANS